LTTSRKDYSPGNHDGGNYNPDLANEAPSLKNQLLILDWNIPTASKSARSQIGAYADALAEESQLKRR
jgi:hypothetical protein